DLPKDTKFCVQCGAPIASNETAQPTLTRAAEAKACSERLRKRSLASVYFEAVRLYVTNLKWYLPAIVLPSLVIYVLEIIKPFDPANPSVGRFVIVFIDVLVAVLLSGILGHITSHIYVGRHTHTSDTLKSAMRLVPAEFVAGILPALGAGLTVALWLKFISISGTGMGVFFILMPAWAALLWAISILASIVVESEGIRNPVRAIVRACRLLNVRKKVYRDGLFIVFVIVLNMTIVWYLGHHLGYILTVKLTLEPIFEIVYGLLYFNLRFMEGGFDTHVLAQELGLEPRETVFTPPIKTPSPSAVQ